MIFLTYIVIIAAIVSFAGMAASKIHSRKVYGLSHSSIKELSWPSRNLLKMYNELPSENRPYANLYQILKALDVKHSGAKAVNEHFTRTNYSNVKTMSWNCCLSYRSHGNEACSDYKEIKTSIERVASAVREQEHALAVAAVEGGLSDAQELLDRLNDEARLVRGITKELTNGNR